nr:MAG TPA_asm: hypothetical protein [Caudoviricetes sp.]
MGGRWARPCNGANMRHCMPTVAHLNNIRSRNDI